MVFLGSFAVLCSPLRCLVLPHRLSIHQSVPTSAQTAYTSSLQLFCLQFRMQSAIKIQNCQLNSNTLAGSLPSWLHALLTLVHAIFYFIFIAVNGVNKSQVRTKEYVSRLRQEWKLRLLTQLTLCGLTGRKLPPGRPRA